VVNGWTLAFHSFDYNLDHLGPGTIDDPAWKMPDRHASYLARTLAARGGLWGNHGYEAAYPMTYTDADGDQLDGRHRYTLTFGQDPPVDAFWSITVYDLPASTWSPTRSTGTPSATAPPACAATATGRSPS
jgi:hypothetical protein